MRAEKPPARPSLGRRLVVGREISLTGEIRECEKLVIEGKVTADISDTEALEIAKPGHFRGSAVVRDCEISGVFEGDLDVTGLLKLRAGGRASGRIRYAEVEIERGGKLTGDVDLRGGSRTTAGEAAPVGVRAPQPLPDPPATPKLRLR
jgi:cytoskeletal protein CcmA (bactofilin family)